MDTFAPLYTQSCAKQHMQLTGDFYLQQPFLPLTPFHHFLSLSQNRERERVRKSSIIFSGVPLSRLPN